MKAIVLILSTITTMVFGSFTPFPPANPTPSAVVSKGSLLTSDGVSQVEALACADGEIIEYDAAETYGFKCATIPSSATIGEIKEMHTFNGLIPIPRGWMVLDGDIVNEANYDAIHGAGAYVADGVATSSILNRNLPNMIGKYSVAVAATSQDGTAPITSVGNISNQTDLSHTHNGSNHVHQVVNYTANANDTYYNASGNLFTPARSTTFQSGFFGFEVNEKGNLYPYYVEDLFTSASGASATSSSLSATQDIQPESIEVIKIMKVI